MTPHIPDNRQGGRLSLESGRGTWWLTPELFPLCAAPAGSQPDWNDAEPIQTAVYLSLARRPGLWSGVLARQFCALSSARDRRDRSARQVSQAPLKRDGRPAESL